MKQNQILEKLNKLENILTKKDDKPLSFREAAAYLGFRPSYLYKLTHRKLIPFFKPSGKMLFFAKSDLDEWVFGKSKVESKKLKENDPRTTQREGSRIDEEDEEPP